ncbi:MAG: aspartate carbamoyltransferase catalytic subunit [Bacteroidetes bacterium]|nr:aspartate carbamoyltransferase catalytic subunit [Bacteroidota bacterium]MDA0902727.1 aspartate carbamoyltransferase catalytic subunit [Bacteroidota bacterium]MDA1241808.1 aspartate carbamoyltransferase catalytic subunit [Bacteroidota bacterium]
MTDFKQLSQPSLLGIRGLTRGDIDLIHATAKEFKDVLNRPIKKVPSLRDFTVANLFFEDSTRTRLSFELAEKRLSADVVNFSAAGSSVKKGETLVDTVNNILAMKVDMVVMRHPHPGAHHFLASKVKVPIVNAGDGTHEHPTQALLDTFSLREALGHDLNGKNIAIVGDIKHSRVALSNILALKLLGANVRVCGPQTLIPKHMDSLGVEVSHDLDDTIRWADALNMLRIQLERQGDGGSVRFFPTLREYTMRFGLTMERLTQADRDVVVMHPGPINRGVEITSEVADCHQAIILDQVEHGVAVRMAVLYMLSQHRPD